jgi:four helix bundle protein
VATIIKFTDLLTWQKGHSFVLAVYKSTARLPQSEQFGLTGQIRRAAVSVTSNIVEGFERGTNKEFRQFLIISRASLAETQNQLLLAKDLGYLKKEDFERLAGQSVELRKMINGFIKSLQTRSLATH